MTAGLSGPRRAGRGFENLLIFLLTFPPHASIIHLSIKKIVSDLTRPFETRRGQHGSLRPVSGLVFCADTIGRIRFFIRSSDDHYRRCSKIAIQNHLLNDEIREPEVRLISETGEQLGIMSGEEALRVAEERDMDLVLISPQAKPPVCRIMDYGKFRFEQTKKEKEARKNQHTIEVKEIRMSPGIGDNDFNTKLKNGQKFLSDGNRLKVTVRFRGREMAHTNIGEQLLKSFAEQCSAIATMDKNPKLEGRNMSVFLSPKVPDKQSNKK